MLQTRRIWPLIAIATSLLILLAVAHLAAQKRVTESTNAFGQGTTINKDYNPDGTLSREEYVDVKGRLREVKTYSYDPDTNGLIQENTEIFREDGSLDWDYIKVLDGKGHFVKSWSRDYDPQGNQTSGYIYDAVNQKRYVWNRDNDTYEEFEFRIESGIRLPPAKPQEKKPEQPTPQGKKPGDISYEPVELGMLMPSNVQPGDTFSGTVMAAADAKNFDGVPGLTVKIFNAPLPDGQFSPVGYQGLTIGTTDTGPAPVEDGHFTLTVPPAKVTVSLVNRQEDDPRSTPTTTNLSLATPSWAGSSISRPTLTRAELDFGLSYLNYLWFKVTDYKEEWWDAYDDGAPDWVLAEIDEDIDSAQAAADRLARSLPLEEVRKLALWKAIYEAWLDEHYHHGMSVVHKDNIDYYTYRAVPQDYFARSILYALTAPPILQVGRLGVLRGTFSGDCNDTRVKVDGLPVRFIASNLTDYYFMPPEEMTPGSHTLFVWNGPFHYRIPVFAMKLLMSIDTSMLHTRSFPKSTVWHLTLLGLNGFPASNWSGGSFSPDLVSISDLGKLPEGFQPPDQTRQGVIVLKASNLSQNIISIPELPGGQRTWVLDAQKFAPSGEFHFDARADALQDGNFLIRGLAVAMLKPVIGMPERPGPPSGGAPETLPTSAQSSGKIPAQLLQQAGDAYTEAQHRTETKRVAMNKAWDNACSKASPQLRSAYETAGKDFAAADKAWQSSVKEYGKNPTDENHKKIAPLSTDRYQKKLTFDLARDAVVNHLDPASREAWHAAHTDYEDSAYHEAVAKEDLEGAYKAAGPTK